MEAEAVMAADRAQNGAAEVLGNGMHIRVCDLDGDGSSITVNFFIENVIAEIFEKERDGSVAFWSIVPVAR